MTRCDCERSYARALIDSCSSLLLARVWEGGQQHAYMRCKSKPRFMILKDTVTSFILFSLLSKVMAKQNKLTRTAHNADVQTAILPSRWTYRESTLHHIVVGFCFQIGSNFAQPQRHERTNEMLPHSQCVRREDRPGAFFLTTLSHRTPVPTV